MPRGGARVGAGRKPLSAAQAGLRGSRQRTVVRFPGQPGQAVAPEPAPEPVVMPETLPLAAKEVWVELAPFAERAGTLTKATVAAFAMLCRAVVLERQLAQSALGAAGADHRGMMQRVEAGMLRFSLAPNGKSIVQPKKPVDPFAEFYEGTARG